MEKPKQAKETAKRALALAPGKAERGAALHLAGLASFQSADGKEAELREAVALLEEAVGLGGSGLQSSKLTLAHARNALGESEAAGPGAARANGIPAGQTRDIAKESRILLCQIRLHHPEIRPASSGNTLKTGEGEVQNPEGCSRPLRTTRFPSASPPSSRGAE